MEIGLLNFMLKLLAFKSFNDKVLLAFETIHLPVQLGNDFDGFVHSKETFYVIEAKSRYNAVMNTEW